MKKQLINVATIVIMAIIANYPMYKSIKATTADLQGIIDDVQVEVLMWKNEVADLQHELSNFRAEVHNEVEAAKERAMDTVKETLDVKSLLKLAD